MKWYKNVVVDGGDPRKPLRGDDLNINPLDMKKCGSEPGRWISKIN